MDLRDITIILNLYFGQREVVQIQGDKGNLNKKSVLSPKLINLFSEEIRNKALIYLSYGIKITPIDNLRYADDTILRA